MTSENQKFWRGRRVFVTGHTGFKGAWLCYWLTTLGAHVTGYAQPPKTDPNLSELLKLSELIVSITGDVTHRDRLASAIKTVQPEFVFHLAAQSQVVPSIEEPYETFLSNVMGTAAVLEAVRHCPSVRSCVIATSDKCYAQPCSGLAFTEDSPLGGTDPYSASKAAAEMVVAAYQGTYYSGEQCCNVSSVRAGNALGGGDWASQRIFPNAVRALRAGNPIVLSHPEAVRPWQYVMEPLSGYIWLARNQFESPNKFAGSWNFGPEEASAVSVRVLSKMIIKAWGSGEYVESSDMQGPLDQPSLRISIAKARDQLEWRPAFDLQQTVTQTISTYRQLYEAKSQAFAKMYCRAACDAAIDAYTKSAQSQELAWAQ